MAETTDTAGAWNRLPWRRLVPGLVAGGVTFLLVAVVGCGYVISRPATWSARASVVVLPREGLDPLAVTGYYDTLSRGQVVATYAEILRLQRFERAAASGAGLDTAARRTVTTDVRVVTGTAMITIAATTRDARSAVGMADGILEAANSYISKLDQPYVVRIVSGAKGTAQQSTPSSPPLLAVIVVVALMLGVGVQQVVWQLGKLLTPPSGGEGSSEAPTAVSQSAAVPAAVPWGEPVALGVQPVPKSASAGLVADPEARSS